MFMFQGTQLVPSKIFFTTGVGTHREKLVSFEMALQAAGIAQQNLVRISSILPPECEIVEREEGVAQLRPGQIVFCVLSEAATNEPGRRVGASIGVAMPNDRSVYGYISEHHGFGLSKKDMGDHAEGLAAQMLATVLGAPFDPNGACTSMNHTCVTQGPDSGAWVTVVSAAVVCG